MGDIPVVRVAILIFHDLQSWHLTSQSCKVEERSTENPSAAENEISTRGMRRHGKATNWDDTPTEGNLDERTKGNLFALRLLQRSLWIGLAERHLLPRAVPDWGVIQRASRGVQESSGIQLPLAPRGAVTWSEKGAGARMEVKIEATLSRGAEQTKNRRIR